MSGRKVIVTVAPTGGLLTKEHNPHLPTQPEEIAEDVARCCAAGASVVALHARRPDDEATCDPAIYRRITELVRDRCDIVVNHSTGGGVNGDMIAPRGGDRWEVSWEERLRGLDGGADLCTLDAMTVVATVDDREVLMETSPSRGLQLARMMSERGIKPEWEAFSPTHLVQEVTTLLQAGFDRPPHVVNLVLGLEGTFQGAMPYTPRALQQMVDLLPEHSIFSVSAAGEAQIPATTHALLLGGHVRVGLEDNLYAPSGAVTTNLEQVERVVQLIGLLGMEPATPDEARAMLGLSGAWASVPAVDRGARA